MQTYSIVFLDLDGTLLNSSHQVSPRTATLLRRIQKHGAPVVLCSARSPAGVELVAKQIDLSGPVVCYGGGLALDEKRSILLDCGMKPDIAVRFKNFAAENFPGIAVCAYLYDVWLVDDADHPVVRREAEIVQCTPLKGDLLSAARSVPHVHKMLCIGAPGQILQLQKEASAKFPGLDFARSAPAYLEVLAKGVSKCGAVKKLQEIYGVAREEVVACGDNFVDLDMLQYAGLGIAMGNAPEKVKQAADMVTASNDEEGVFIALKNLRFRGAGTVREESRPAAGRGRT